jgi:hypothetical protein
MDKVEELALQGSVGSPTLRAQLRLKDGGSTDHPVQRGDGDWIARAAKGKCHARPTNRRCCQQGRQAKGRKLLTVQAMHA